MHIRDFAHSIGDLLRVVAPNIKVIVVVARVPDPSNVSHSLEVFIEMHWQSALGERRRFDDALDQFFVFYFPLSNCSGEVA